MDVNVSVGLMKMGLRAQICSQCRPDATAGDATQVLAPHPCESNCALFVQLPRLARFLARHRGKPPSGYEESVLKLLCDFSTEITDNDRLTPDPEGIPGPYMDYSAEALAILERLTVLLSSPAVEKTGHDCARQSHALGQLAVQASCKSSGIIDQNS